MVPLRVEAYAGARYPERPIAVWMEGERLAVLELIRSWRTPDALHFLVDVERLARVELVYRDEVWQFKPKSF
ncbi:MAG: hypothetical protein GXP42_17865 [Chloroflexi bacterium]|nr:hypothetical protein [Chloroflexota bacterium]